MLGGRVEALIRYDKSWNNRVIRTPIATSLLNNHSSQRPLKVIMSLFFYANMVRAIMHNYIFFKLKFKLNINFCRDKNRAYAYVEVSGWTEMTNLSILSQIIQIRNLQ